MQEGPTPTGAKWSTESIKKEDLSCGEQLASIVVCLHHTILYILSLLHRISTLCFSWQPGHLLLAGDNHLSNGWAGAGGSAGRRWQLELEYIPANREPLIEQDFPKLRCGPSGEYLM